jgi:hypothetical protein
LPQGAEEENLTMRSILAITLGLAGAVSLSAAADARDGCGRGYHFNGYACVPSYGPPPQPYWSGQGWGGPPPGRYYAPSVPNYYGNVVRPVVGANGAISCSNPRYTWQNGACQPYTGR